MAKKITLKNKNGDVLCPHTAIEQVQGLKEALEGKLGKNEPATSVVDGSISTSKIADTAITSAKLASSLILKGTPQLATQPTLSSESQNIASVGLVKKAVENIEIGGRNLVVNSSTPISSTAYFIGNLSLYENLIENSVYTITIWGELGADRTSFYLYPEWGMGGALCELQQVSNGVYNATFIYHKGNATNSNAVGLYQMPSAGTSTSTIERIKIEKGNKATDWTPAPEDINTEISNAETRSKAFAEDYANAEIDKIENGETVAQKANSLYDADSNKYKNWGEIDTAITRKIGNKFEDYATKSYVQGEISKQVAVPIASETEDGKVKLATPEDVTAVENDISAVNDSAKAVTPYTLKEYIASKNFATSGDISSAVTAAKTTIFFQVAQPAGGKDGDIWIKP